MLSAILLAVGMQFWSVFSIAILFSKMLKLVLGKINKLWLSDVRHYRKLFKKGIVMVVESLCASPAVGNILGRGTLKRKFDGGGSELRPFYAEQSVGSIS
jgi:hypothetical protein